MDGGKIRKEGRNKQNKGGRKEGISKIREEGRNKQNKGGRKG